MDSKPDVRHALLPSKSRDSGGEPVPVLETRHLSINFGGLTVVEDFNISIKPMDIFALIGPNGAGKTTVFNLITKVYRPTRGTILIKDTDTAGMSAAQVSKLGVARTFQNIRLFNNLTVMDNVKIGMHNHIHYSMWSAIFRLPKFWKEEKRAHETARRLLSIFDMHELADRRAGALPYGAQRRLELIRALAANPRILLLDEPAAGMNPSETEELMKNIVKVRDTFKIAIMLIEHDMNLVMGICEKVCVLNFGRVIAKGDPASIQNNPDVIEAYLGKGRECELC